MSRRTLITGITGQDGSYLAEFLLERGYEVHGLVRRSSTERTERIEHLRGRVHSLRFSGRIDDSTASRVNRRFDVETLHINGPLDVE